MEVVHESGAFYLEAEGQRLTLTDREVNLFRQMKPMGRQLLLRKRAADKRNSDPDDPEIKLILRFAKMPALEWNFPIPV
jgi:hypothetical protein